MHTSSPVARTQRHGYHSLIFFLKFFIFYFSFMRVRFNYYRFWVFLGDLRQFCISFGMVNRFRIESV